MVTNAYLPDLHVQVNPLIALGRKKTLLQTDLWDLAREVGDYGFAHELLPNQPHENATLHTLAHRCRTSMKLLCSD